MTFGCVTDSVVCTPASDPLSELGSDCSLGMVGGWGRGGGIDVTW